MKNGLVRLQRILFSQSSQEYGSWFAIYHDVPGYRVSPRKIGYLSLPYLAGYLEGAVIASGCETQLINGFSQTECADMTLRSLRKFKPVAEPILWSMAEHSPSLLELLDSRSA